jgi:hypothetical protein
MKLIYKLLLIPVLTMMACKKEPEADVPKPEVADWDTLFTHNINYRTNPGSIWCDNDDILYIWDGSSYIHKFNPEASKLKSMSLSPIPWLRSFDFTPNGHFYRILESLENESKHTLLFNEFNQSTKWYNPPVVVNINQTKLKNRHDEVWYQFGNNYSGHLANMSSELSCLQTGTKYVKSAITGKIDTFDILLKISDPFNVTDQQEMVIPHFVRKQYDYVIYFTNKYILLTEDYNYFYRYDKQLNLIDSFSIWPKRVFWEVNNQFLYQKNGYFLSTNGNDEGEKIELLENNDRITNVNESIIYAISTSGDLFSLDLKTNKRTYIVNRKDQRFKYENIFIYHVWKNNKTGKYYLFTEIGLYVI